MNHVSRRAVALSVPAAFLTVAPGIPVGISSGQARAQSPKSAMPLAQIRIGRFTVTALSDGFADMPFDYFPGRAANEVEAAARAQFSAKPGGIRFMFNQYLIEDGDRRILVDTGTAGSLGQSGQLPQVLGALSIPVDGIDAVIVTHMHQDHMGGLVSGGRRSFPASELELYVDRRDVAHGPTRRGKRGPRSSSTRASTWLPTWSASTPSCRRPREIIRSRAAFRSWI